MIKIILLILLLIVILLWLSALLPSSIGLMLYNKMARAEASAYGFKTHSLAIGDIELTFYTNSQAEDARPTIVLLHGFSADKNVWPRFAKHFTKTHRVIIPDLAGHGDTGFDKTWDYSAPAQATRVKQLLDKLNIDQVHIMGNSMGGFISAHFARLYPDRTLSAVLIDPAGVRSPQPSDMQVMVSQGQRNPFMVNNQQEFDEFFAMTMTKPPWLPKLLKKGVAQQYQARRNELLTIMMGFYDQDMLDSSLSEITPPVLVLWGEQDRLIHVSSIDVWQTGLPQVAVHIWPDLGHMPMVEAPLQSARVVGGFIASVPP